MKISIEQADLDSVLAARAKSARSIRFTPGLEVEYQAALWKARRRGTYIVCLAAIVIFDLFLISDYISYPKFFVRDAVIRLAIYTPIALLGTVITYLHPKKTVRQISQMIVMVIAAISVLAVVRGISEVASMAAQAGLILVAAFGSLVLRIEFPYALTTNVIIIAADLEFLLWGFGSQDPIRVTCFFLIVTCSLLSLLANFRLEQIERSNYLLLLSEELRGHRLTQANRTLADLSKIDGLTGLANRRCLNEFFESKWSSTRSDDESISIIMSDIDHFKHLNDTAGHLYGDQVLQHFAKILERSIRKDRDLVARFGGEEFLIVLPNIARDRAAEIAERLRRDACEELGRNSPVAGLKITVSFGVATTLLPTDRGSAASSAFDNSAVSMTSAELIAAADEALYRAKRSGRNRVCQAG